MQVAVIQAAPVLFNRAETLKKVDQLTGEAAGQGARLVLFPESFIPAYPRGLSFGAVVGHRSDEGRRQWLEYWREAVALPGEAAAALADIARRREVWLVIGVTERDAAGYTLYCSLLYYSPDGRLLARHRKLKPTASERLIWGDGPGDDLQVVPTEGGRAGGLICWENYLPLARQALYEQGVDIYLAPTADARDSWQATLRHIACEGRCYVLGANQYVRRDHYPAGWRDQLPGQEEILCRGGSAVVDPYGNYLAGPLFGEEGILYATVDKEEIIRAKMDFDPVGHYARPDVLRLKYSIDPGTDKTR